MTPEEKRKLFSTHIFNPNQREESYVLYLLVYHNGGIKEAYLHEYREGNKVNLYFTKSIEHATRYSTRTEVENKFCLVSNISRTHNTLSLLTAVPIKVKED